MPNTKSDEEYKTASTEYNRRTELPAGHPMKMHNFKDWLIHYNVLDCIPLAKAIDKSFDTLFKVFNIDPSTCLSLPRFAQMCVFKSFCSQSPLCYSFTQKMDHIRNLFRANILGGLVNVYSRYTELDPNESDVPKSARYSGNGEKFTKITFFDFNALYLHAQSRAFPTTPGKFFIFCVSNKYIKSVLCNKII